MSSFWSGFEKRAEEKRAGVGSFLGRVAGKATHVGLAPARLVAKAQTGLQRASGEFNKAYHAQRRKDLNMKPLQYYKMRKAEQAGKAVKNTEQAAAKKVQPQAQTQARPQANPQPQANQAPKKPMSAFKAGLYGAGIGATGMAMFGSNQSQPQDNTFQPRYY